MELTHSIVLLSLFSLALCHQILTVPSIQRYDPTWESLDSRPIPSWYDEAKVGIFIHWGVFSVPSFGSEWFWSNWKISNSSKYIEFMKNYPPGFTYQEFAKDFTAVFFDAREWARIFKDSGAKYVVLTSKHHEGYTLWPSKYSFSWNSVDIGPHRDIIRELSEAVRKENLTFGLYHSLYEWFNPMYLEDKANNFETRNFIEKKILPEMEELINNYEPDVLWSDGDWEAPEDYWQSREFLAWLYNDSPVKSKVVVNDRWGINMTCQHGDFYTCQDRFNPGVLQKHKWENAMTIDRHSWGFRRNAELGDYLSTYELLKTLVETVSCGGNILINVGPTKDGIIPIVYQERLQDLGKWLSVNSAAIYGSKPWEHQNDTVSNTWYTTKNNVVYALTLEWPQNNDELYLAAPVGLYQKIYSVNLLGYAGELRWRVDWTPKQEKVLIVSFPWKSNVHTDWVYVIAIETM